MVEQYGSPLELYERPANIFVAGFIGSPKMNLVTLPKVTSQYGAATIGVRPEHITVSRDGKGWPGKIAIAEHLGSDTFFYVESELGQITVRTAGELGYKTGDTDRDDARSGADPSLRQERPGDLRRQIKEARRRC